MNNSQKRFGLYFVSMATAYGLGNIWRFPYLVFDYGKGSFLLLFCFLCFFIGVPLLVTEILLGKSFYKREHESSSYILKSIFFKSKFSILWWLPSFITLFVLSYYTLISTWVLHYAVKLLYAEVADTGFATNTTFLILMNRPVLIVLLASVHLLLIYLLLNKGEKIKYKFWMGSIIPLLTLAMGYVAYRYFILDDVLETAKVLLYPNFGMLKKESLNFALGHMLFTLSLGFGTIIGLGQSMDSETSSTSAAAKMGLSDSLISILLVAAIFPMVTNIEYGNKGSDLLFYVIPGYFSENGLTLLMAFIFYFLIYLCSLNASLGLAETISSNIFESTKLSKSRSHFVTCLVLFIMCVASISFAVYSKSLLEFMGFKNAIKLNVSEIVVFVDDVLINFILPLSVIIGLRAASKHLESDYVKNDFELNEGIKSWPYYLYWKFVISIGFPLIFLLSLFLRFF